MIKMHASVVSVKGQAVLLRGPSGFGKSDLALRMMDQGADLVSDDYVELEVKKGQIIARPPKAIQGLMEVRGLGLIKVQYLEEAVVTLAYNLVGSNIVDRVPVSASRLILDGVAIPLFSLDGLAASGPTKIKMALSLQMDLQEIEGLNI